MKLSIDIRFNFLECTRTVSSTRKFRDKFWRDLRVKQLTRMTRDNSRLSMILIALKPRRKKLRPESSDAKQRFLGYRRQRLSKIDKFIYRVQVLSSKAVNSPSESKGHLNNTRRFKVYPKRLRFPARLLYLHRKYLWFPWVKYWLINYWMKRTLCHLKFHRLCNELKI